jgi:transglutaminase superfamily protein
MSSLETQLASDRPLPVGSKGWLIAEVLVAYARVRWSLWRSDLPATVSGLRCIAASNGGVTAEHERRLCARLAHAVVRTLSVLPTDSRCLMRSLVLTRLLARRGIHSTLVLGVRGDGDFAAHAWVEHDMVALLAPGGAEFKRLVEI